MKAIVLDASVILKAVLPKENEVEDRNTLKIFEKYRKGEIEIFVPIFWVFEIGNTLSRKLPLEKVQLGFTLLLSQGFKEYNLSHSELLEISKFSSQNSVSFYDASYHLLAHFTYSVFVTADKKYFEKFRQDKHIALLQSLKI